MTLPSSRGFTQKDSLPVRHIDDFCNTLMTYRKPSNTKLGACVTMLEKGREEQRMDSGRCRMDDD
jgi:hypothetical protein